MESGRMRRLPLLPLRGVLVFPGLVVPLEVGRPRSLAALEAALLADGELFFVSQRDPLDDDPGVEDLFEVGVVATIKQVAKLANGTAKVVVEGRSRARRTTVVQEDPFFLTDVLEWDPVPASADPNEVEALQKAVADLFEAYVKRAKRIPGEVGVTVNLEDPGRLADTITAVLDLKTAEKQEVLELADPYMRLRKVQDLLNHQIDILELERRINVRVRRQMERTQKEYYLREQLKAIQRELGEREEPASEAQDLRERLEQKSVPEAVREKILREVDRLEKMPGMSAEAVVVRTYLDWLLALPWEERTEDCLDVKQAEAVLEADHYGLEQVKERILEYLAVRQLSNRLRGPILCLVGPPGVGKTSLARSIAQATNRKFVRVSLGGVRDEAEIRGHRRTYVGAMPGRIIQGMRQAGSKNPVFLLDEVDKMATDFRGDPSAALLEVLDPEQNQNFSDHYIELPFDLSSVMFITTANVLHQIPRPLLDRMEVITIAGYTEEEKFHIARRHLLPKALPEHGLTADDVDFSAPALAHLIRYYTREAGVRQLEREIGKVLRKVARAVVAGQPRPVRVTRRQLVRYLGPPRVRHQAPETEDQVGVAMGLAVTEVGGDVMPVEVMVMPGKGGLTLTGQLGDVMQESARAAYSYIRAHADELGVPQDFYQNRDLHVHVPEGAIPKDGPSAGVTMATAMVSALAKRPVKAGVAMTGEITLRGRVLAVGGIKEKVLAAHRAGIRTVVLPRDNMPDLHEVPQNVRRALKIVPVERLGEVFEWALGVPEPVAP
jgi:ATP-dependent Lon protease